MSVFISGLIFPVASHWFRSAAGWLSPYRSLPSSADRPALRTRNCRYVRLKCSVGSLSCTGRLQRDASVRSALCHNSTLSDWPDPELMNLEGDHEPC